MSQVAKDFLITRIAKEFSHLLCIHLEYEDIIKIINSNNPNNGMHGEYCIDDFVESFEIERVAFKNVTGREYLPGDKTDCEILFVALEKAKKNEYYYSDEARFTKDVTLEQLKMLQSEESALLDRLCRYILYLCLIVGTLILLVLLVLWRM